MTDLDEFIAEGLTQPKFQQFLDKGNLWTRFVELVRKLLGLEPKFQSQLNTVLKTGAELIAGSKNISRMRYVGDIETFSSRNVTNNRRAMQALLSGTPSQMRNAVAKAQKPTDKIIKEGADLQKKNRGCD
jgi:hypothetical protein